MNENYESNDLDECGIYLQVFSPYSSLDSLTSITSFDMCVMNFIHQDHLKNYLLEMFMDEPELGSGHNLFQFRLELSITLCINIGVLLIYGMQCLTF